MYHLGKENNSDNTIIPFYSNSKTLSERPDADTPQPVLKRNKNKYVKYVLVRGIH
jgi:hypothetical protein